MLSNVGQDILTVEDQMAALDQLEEIVKSCYKNQGSDFKQLVSKTAKYSISEAIFSRLSGESDRGIQVGVVEKLKLEIKKLRTIKVTLAINPTMEMIKNISQWVKVNLGQDVILEIKVDNRIIAGIVIAFEGKYGSFTAKEKIDAYWEDNRSEISGRLGL